VSAHQMAKALKEEKTVLLSTRKVPKSLWSELILVELARC